MVRKKRKKQTTNASKKPLPTQPVPIWQTFEFILKSFGKNIRSVRLVDGDASGRVDFGSEPAQQLMEGLGGCESLYDQIKLLQAWNNKRKKGSEPISLGSQRYVALLLLYTSSEATKLRKTLAGIFDTMVRNEQLEQVEQIVSEVVEALMTSFTSSDCSEVPTQDTHLNQVTALQCLLDLPLCHKILLMPQDPDQRGRRLYRCLEFLANVTEEVSSPIKPSANGGDEASSLQGKNELGIHSSGLMAAAENCGVVLKTCISLLQTSISMDGEICLASLTPIHRLLTCCLTLLICESIGRSTHTQAAMAFALLARTALPCSELVEALATFFGTPTNNEVEGTAHILKSLICTYGPQVLCSAQMALHRAFTASIPLSSLMQPLQDTKEGEITLCSLLGSRILLHCKSPNGSDRLFSIQSLNTWLMRVCEIVALVKKSPETYDGDFRSKLLSQLTAVIEIVLWSWEHPMKQVSGHLASIFDKVMQCKLQLGDAIEEEYILGKVMQQNPMHKGKYSALSVLIPRLSKELMYKKCQILLPNLLEALSFHQDLQKGVAQTFIQLITLMKQQCRDETTPYYQSEEAVRQVWVNPLAQALVQEKTSARQRVGQQVVSLLLKLDHLSGVGLLNAISNTEIHGSTTRARQLWAKVEVVKHMRMLGMQIDISEHETEDIHLTIEDMTEAALSADRDLRLSAIHVLVLHPKQTVFPSQAEILVFQRVLPANLKNAQSDHRHRLSRSLVVFLTRLRESVRFVLSKNYNSDLVDPKEAERDYPSEASSFLIWLNGLLLDNLYPGAVFERQVLVLDLLQVVTNTFSHPSTPNCLLNVVRSQLYSSSLVFTLLNLLINSWDHNRTTAFNLLLSLPLPLPGLESDEEIQMVLQWAVRMAGSARKRESEAGALMLKLLHKIHFMHQDSGFQVQNGVVELNRSLGKDGTVVFLESLCNLISERLALMETMMRNLAGNALGVQSPDSEQFPLIHGYLQTLHIVLEDYDFSGLRNVEEPGSQSKLESWKQLIARILLEVHRALEVSLLIVADPGNESSPLDQPATYSSSVPTNANEGKSGIAVDCRGHIIFEDTELSEGWEEQHVVVGSWLIAKETSACFAVLLNSVPFQEASNGSKSGNPDVSGLVSISQIEDIAALFVRALQGMKHWGAVFACHSGFQSVCEALLLRGSQDSALCSLPSKWLHGLFEHLQSSKQQFVLRRSAGFAYSFLSILRAEPRNCPATLLPYTLKHLANLASVSDDKTLHWGIRVHAMNILRLIFLDATLADDVLKYAGTAFITAIEGFEDLRWAVRNSAMMLFSSVLQRSVDNNKNDISAKRSSTSFKEFFHSHPGLDVFLLDRLEKSISLSSREQLHPALYPLLLLLSRLSGNTEADPKLNKGVHHSSIQEQEQQLRLEAFLSLLKGCSNQRHYQTRMMAAKALSSMIPFARILDTVVELLHTLGHPDSNNGISLPMNLLHGTLVQIYELLKKHCHEVNPEGTNRDEAFTQVLFLVGAKSSWLLFCGCPEVQRVFLQVCELLDEMGAKESSLSLIQDHVPDFVNVLTQEEFQNVPIPGLSLCKSQAVRLFVMKSLSASAKGGPNESPRQSMIGSVFQLLTSKDGDVRGAAIKGAKKVITQNQMPLQISHQLGECLVTLLHTETYPPNQRRVLRTLCKLGSQLSLGETDQIWGTPRNQAIGLLMDLCGEREDASSDVQANSLELMGYFICSTSEKDMVYKWLQLLLMYSQSDKAAAMREAAVFSIKAAGVLDWNGPSSLSACIQCWFIMLSLLQDDEISIRETSLEYVWSIITQNSDNGTAKLLLSDDESKDKRFGASEMEIDQPKRLKTERLVCLPNPSTPPCSPEVLERAFSYMAQRFGSSNEYAEHLIQALQQFNKGKRFFEMHKSNMEMISKTIFEPDENNMYVEPVVTILWTVLYLGQFLNSLKKSSGFDKTSRLVRECANLYTQHKQLIELFVDANQTSTWLGGASYHGDTFSSIYTSLAICFVLAPYVEEDLDNALPDQAKHLCLDNRLKTMSGNISSHLHPLVSRMFCSFSSLQQEKTKDIKDDRTKNSFLFLCVKNVS